MAFSFGGTINNVTSVIAVNLIGQVLKKELSVIVWTEQLKFYGVSGTLYFYEVNVYLKTES